MYRKQYLIGIYAPISEGETLLALCYNIKEFAELMGIKYSAANQILHYIFVGKNQGIRFQGRICSVAFIEEDDE